ESLQEQYQWHDSLVLLDESFANTPTEYRDRLFTNRVRAQHHLGMVGSDNIDAILGSLLEIAQGAGLASQRVTALQAAARIAHSERHTALNKSLTSAAHDLENNCLAPTDRLAVHYALSMLLRQAGDRAGSLHHLQTGARMIETSAIANSVAGSITLNLGSALCGEGDYEGALTQFAAAHRLAEKQRIDDLLALAAANQALCHGRLGRYDKQVEWANAAELSLKGRFVGYRNVQVATYQGMGYAMLGKTTVAQQSVDYLSQRMPETVPLWILQAWQLNKADVLLLCGKDGRALKEAIRGTTHELARLQSDAYAGPFARWLALTEKPGLDAHQTVHELYARIGDFDAIDRVQIAAARIHLLRNERRANRVRMREAEELRSYCLRIPLTALSQLRALGLPLGPTSPPN
ncbi:MAG TPA: hypothetical protein VF037_05460, partial [Gemmatimonadales bacterium]